MTEVQQSPAWVRARQQFEGTSPREVARDILKNFKVDLPPVDVDSIASRLINGRPLGHLPGEAIRMSGLGSWDAAVTSVEASSGFRASIWVREGLSTNVRRYMIAHELGHLLLHPIGSSFRCQWDVLSRVSDSATELQSDHFAFELIAPLSMLEPLATARQRTSEELARIFGVPTGVIIHQLTRLSNHR